MVKQTGHNRGDRMDLSASAREIVEVIGQDATLRLINGFSVRRDGSSNRRGPRIAIYVPRKMSSDHRISAIVGFGAALALSRAFGGEMLMVAPPNDAAAKSRQRNAEIVRLATNDNKSPAEIAGVFGISERWVRRIVGAKELAHMDLRASNDA
jgi:Homeodomain-like domain